MQYHPETIKANITILAIKLKNLSERTMPKDLSFFGPESGIPKNSMLIASVTDLLNDTLDLSKDLATNPETLIGFKSLLTTDSHEGGIFEHNRQIITQAQGSFAQMTAPTAEDRQQVEEIFSRIHEVYDCLVAEIRPMIETESAPSPSAR